MAFRYAPIALLLLAVLALSSAGCGRVDFQATETDEGVADGGRNDGAAAARDGSAGPDGGWLDGSMSGIDAALDGGMDAGVIDLGPWDPSVPLVEECSHRWIAITDIHANFKLSTWVGGVVVAGFTESDGSRVDAHDETDGSIVWTRPRSGNFAGGASGSYAVYQETGGVLARHAVVDLRDGTDAGQFDYWNTTFGFGEHRIGVRETGESLVPRRATPSDPDTGMPVDNWSMSVDGTPITGPGPATILLQHDAAGAYVRHVQVADAAYSLEPFPVSGGRWSMAVVAATEPLTFGGHVVAPGASELVTLNADLSFAGATPIPGSVSHSSAVPGTALRVLGSGSNVRAYDDTGLLWERPDCGSRVVTTRSHVYVLGGVSYDDTFCGAMLPAGASGLVVAALDPATGETVHARLVPWAIGLYAGVVSPDGDVYIAFPTDGAAAATVCGEEIPPSTTTVAIVAL